MAAVLFFLTSPVWNAPGLTQNPAASAAAASPAAARPGPASPFQALAFLEGNWEATTHDTAGIHVVGTYAFKAELGGHILARHATSLTACKGPESFDCEHGDMLYIFADGPGQPLKAIYFDNEGHVIHYNVTTPDATTAVFLTDASQPGPQFRLTYELKNAVMWGKFQMHMPGPGEWQSYLEWSGVKR